MNWKKYDPYFSEKEFRDDQKNCWIQKDLLDKLMIARLHADIPFVITSACRNPAQNERVGGKKGSEHLSGEAVDIAANGSRQRYLIISAAVKAGFTRIGIAKDFIHLGTSKTHDQDVIWMY